MAVVYCWPFNATPIVTSPALMAGDIHLISVVDIHVAVTFVDGPNCTNIVAELLTNPFPLS